MVNIFGSRIFGLNFKLRLLLPAGIVVKVGSMKLLRWQIAMRCLGFATILLFANSYADEAAIRKNLPPKLPNLPAIKEVRRTPIPGLWEVQFGGQVLYSDALGDFIIQGEIYDVHRQVNLTKERIAALTAFDYSKLPLQDAVKWSKGTGTNKLVIFADPNCGYCKHFEQELDKLDNITVYTFLIPILGGDSPTKSQAIWCATDRAKVWRNWMVKGLSPPAAPACETGALERNLELASAHAVNGTPTLIFENSKLVTGMMSIEAIEDQFAAIAASKR